MAETRKTILQPSVDATKVKQGFQQMKDAAQDMGQSVNAAGKQAKEGVDGITQSTEKLNREQTRLLDQLKKNAVIATEGRAAYLELRAAQAGVSSQAAEYVAKLRQAEQSQVSLGISAKQTAAALRGVPAQFTDIITSIQGGQAPLTVLLQQGGQLKDMFGGIGPAARALGGYIAGLVNPFTVAAAAIGVIAVAAHKGSEELRAFENALTLTGNAAGQSSNGFTKLRDEIAAVAGTKGKAAEALTAIAASGRIVASEFKGIGEAAVLMEKATGQAIDKTIQQFIELAKSPTEASAKLNEQYNFLTASVYRQIKALEDQGKTQDAANLAERTYADALKTRAQSVIENVGLMERAWRGVSGAAKQAWDTMLNVGRQQSLGEQLQGVQNSIARGRQPLVLGFGSNAEDRAQLKDNIERERRLIRLMEIEQGTAAAAQAAAEATRAEVEFSKIVGDNRTKQQKAEVEIAKVRALGLAAGRSELEIEKQVAAIREKYKESPKAAPKIAIDPAALAAARQYSDAIRQLTKIEQDANAKTEELSKTQTILRAVMGSPEWERHGRQMQEQIIYSASLAQGAEDQRAAQEALKKAIADSTNAWEKLRKAQEADEQRDVDAIAKRVADLELEAQTYGLLESQIQRVKLARLEDALAAASGDPYEDTERLRRQIEQQRKLITALEGKELLDANKKAADAASREWERVADSFVDNLMKGGKSVAEYLKDLFRTLVLRPILQPVGNLVGGLANQAVSAGANALGIGNAVGAGSALMGTNAALGFANVTGAGLDGFLAASGGFGTMSTGASLTGVLGAIPGWGWAAMAAAAVAGLIASGGETRVGGQYSNGSLLGAPSGGQIDGAGVAIDATLKSINSLLSGLGSSAQVRQLLSGLEQSEKGKGFAYAGGFLTSGEAFGQTADGFMNRRGDKTKEQALAEFGEELKQATLQALQAADVPGQVGEYLKQLGDIDQLSGGSLDEALGYLQTYMGLQEQLLSLQSTETENLTRARQKELDALPESLRAIAEQIHAEQDLAKVRQEEAAKGQQIANERLGLARQYYQLVGDTQALRALELEGLDASNRFIQERIYAIQDEQAAQVAAQQAIEKAAQSARQAQEDYARSLEDAQDFLGGVTRNIGQYLDSLRSGPAGLLSPRDQLANAKSQFERQLGLAQGGDRDALSSITQYADAFITAQKGFSASGGDTKAVIALVQQTLAALPNQVRAEDLIVAAIKDAAKTTTQAIAGAALSDAENQRLTREALNTPLVEMARKLDAGFSTLDTTLDQKLDFSEFRAGFAGAASEATLKSVFDAIDSNADGFIQRQEATTTAVAKMEAVLASALDSGFSVLDRNADSQITRDEFLTGLAGLATDDVLNQGFDRLDVNGDKIVDRQEATTAAVQSLRAIIDSRLANGFTGLDRSLDGLLDFNEFRTGFVGLASDATLQRIFGEIDENGSGTISALEANVVAVRELQSKVVASLTTGFDELAGQDNQVSRDEFLRAFAGLATDSTLRQLFTGLDTDQDGQISKLEAIRAQTEATASYTGSQKLTGEQMLARLNQDSILSFSRAQMIDFTVYTANGAQRAAAATEGLLALAQSAGLKMQFRRDTVTSGWYATGAAFHGTTITRPTHIAGLGEAGPETILPLANVGGVMGVRATGADSKEVVAAIDRLDARLAAIESNTADGDITINLKNVTVDERVLIEKVIKTTRERAARGEGALA